LDRLYTDRAYLHEMSIRAWNRTRGDEPGWDNVARHWDKLFRDLL